MPVGIVDTKIRGELHSEKDKSLWEKLSDTAAFHNQMYRAICEEIVGIKDGTATHLYHQQGDKEALKALIEVILEMPNKSANFALTRLVGRDGWEKLDGTVSEIQKARDVVSRKIKNTEENLSKVDDSKKAAKEKKAGYEEKISLLQEKAMQFDLALQCFERIGTEGYAPLKDLFERELTHPLLTGSWKISDFKILTDVRPLFNEAVQALKSNYRRQEEYLEKIAAWNSKKKDIQNEPEWKKYEPLQIVFSKEKLGDSLSKLSPDGWVSLIERYGEVISTHWLNGQKISLSDEVRNSAKTASEDSNPKNRKNINWRTQLFRLHPELRELYNFHQKVEGIFGKPPKKPNFTIPDPVHHPRAIIWEQTQCKNIRLAAKAKGKLGKSIEIEIPLLHIEEGKLKTSPTWVSVSGDERLIKDTRIHSGSLEYKDRISGDWLPFNFGAVRLQINPNKNGNDYRVIFTRKTEGAALPDWVDHFKKSRVLPGKFIAVSFVHDPKNQGILKIAMISGRERYFLDEGNEVFVPTDSNDHEVTFTGGERRFLHLKQSELAALNLPHVRANSTGLVLEAEAGKTQEVMRHRHRAEMQNERRPEYEDKLNLAVLDLNKLISESRHTREKLAKLLQLKKDVELLAVKKNDLDAKEKKHSEVKDDETLPKDDRHNQLLKLNKSIIKLKSQIEKLKAKGTKSSLPDDFPDELVREFAKISERIRICKLKIHKRPKDNWGSVKSKGEDRAQAVPGQLIRVIENLRKAYPGYEIALILPEETAHKPKKIFSGHTNQEKMAAQEGGLYLKIVQMAEGRPNPIPVFRVYDYGLDEVSPSTARTTVLKVTYDELSKAFRAPLESHEPIRVFFVTEREDGGFNISEEPQGSYGVKGSNCIKTFCDPELKPTNERIQVNAACAERLLSDSKFLDELNRRFR